MSIFNRIFKVAQAESHSVVDKLEDPIKMTEQGIRDLKKDLQAAMQSLAEVKASAIRLRKDGTDKQSLASDYERKAMTILNKAQAGDLDASQADRLATEALTRKEEAEKEAAGFLASYENQQQTVDQLQRKINTLKQSIGKYENELITMKARAKTAQSMRKINKQLTSVDASGTVAMLQRMKEKVHEEEALAEAYGELAAMPTSVDVEIDQAVGSSANTGASESLAALKARMGLNGGD
jgi:phage shock protein A